MQDSSIQPSDHLIEAPLINFVNVILYTLCALISATNIVKKVRKHQVM